MLFLTNFIKNQEIFKKVLEKVITNDYNIITRSGTPTEQNNKLTEEKHYDTQSIQTDRQGY